MEQIINQIHDLRKKIDTCIQRIEDGYVMRTSETVRALRSFEMAKGWLGKVFAFMELDSPYQVVDKPEDIPETADQSMARFSVQEKAGCTLGGQLYTVNHVRKIIKETLLPALDSIDKEFASIALSVEHAGKVKEGFFLSWQHLHEASMNLGFELQRIRRESVTDPEQEQNNQ